MMRRRRLVGLLLLALATVFLFAQGFLLWRWLDVQVISADNALTFAIGAQTNDTNTQEIAEQLPFPTATELPPATALPAETPAPTSTPAPTETAQPTATAQPTDSPEPTATTPPTITPEVDDDDLEEVLATTEVIAAVTVGAATIAPPTNTPEPVPTAVAVAEEVVGDSAEIINTSNTTQAATSSGTTSWGVIGDGSPAGCNEKSLQEALNGGGYVRFNCGPNPITIPVTKPLHVTLDTEIDGGNLVTLNGQRRTGILFTEQYLNVKIRNLTFVNGVTQQQGGAIDLGYWSDLTVVNSTFRNNSALKESAACDGGGAIFVGGGSVAYIENSVFDSNTAMNGGAINNLRSGLTILNSRFNNNHANHSDWINQFGDCGGGGAVYVDATRKSEFGGPDNIILNGNTYTNNTSNNHGGALFVAVHSGERVEVGFSYFENNRITKIASMPTSGTGGAIWYGKAIGSSINNNFVLYNSTIINNHADKQGGGLWTSIPVTVRNTTFTGNTAVDPDYFDPDDWRKGNGGAIAVAHQVLVSIENSTIVGNRAGFNGGGIVGENIAMRNSIVANNLGDWYTGLQQNCTHAVKDWGGNIQFLPNHAQQDHRHWSGCGKQLRQADPLLGDFGYGVFPLRPDSPAVDGGVKDGCPRIDQRGIARPQGAGCDIGAFEREQ